MLELAATEAALVLCVASPEAVDAVAGLGDPIRIAPDEGLVVGPPGSGADLAAAAADLAAAIDDDAVVLDATDGWAIWTLSGERPAEALAYLSALEPPGDGVVQGDVARVPAKVVVRVDRVHLLVPAMWGAHLRGRILADCAHLGVVERSDPEPWTAAKLGGRT